jgi:uncharacterized membrane protein
MIRKHFIKKNIGIDFRLRGKEVTRIEGFSDAVFAFAVTLLVVSLEVPKTFSELMETMRGFIAFACGFAILFNIWYNQYRFFRRYGLEDTTTIVLTGILLFVVLFFIYPLKFLFNYLVQALMGYTTDVMLPNGTIEPAINAGQSMPLMLIYSSGYIAIFSVFALLYLHAYKHRHELELTELEEFDTRHVIQEQFVQISIGLFSILFLFIGGQRYSGWSGFTYLLIGPAMTINGAIMGKRRKALVKTLNASSPSIP